MALVWEIISKMNNLDNILEHLVQKEKMKKEIKK
jgi:hypothetical protein